MPKRKALSLDELKARAKQIITNNNKTETEINTEYSEVAELVQLYLKLKGEYEFETPKKLYNLQKDSVNYNNWKSVLNRIKDFKVTNEVFLKAFFWHFHKRNLGCPTVMNFKRIRGFDVADNIIPAYKSYLSKLDSEQASPTIGGRVLPNTPTTQLSKEALSQAKLANLMKAHNKSEEEILMKFAKKGVASYYFDLKWLATNSTYQKLCQQGLL